MEGLLKGDVDGAEASNVCVVLREMPDSKMASVAMDLVRVGARHCYVVTRQSCPCCITLPLNCPKHTITLPLSPLAAAPKVLRPCDRVFDAIVFVVALRAGRRSSSRVEVWSSRSIRWGCGSAKFLRHARPPPRPCPLSLPHHKLSSRRLRATTDSTSTSAVRPHPPPQPQKCRPAHLGLQSRWLNASMRRRRL